MKIIIVINKKQTYTSFFECNKNKNESNNLIRDIQEIYGNDLDMSELDNENKLKNILFPYNDLIMNKEKNERKRI